VEVELVVREALLRAMQMDARPIGIDIEAGLFAQADPDRLLQVLTNLLVNAVQHAGAGAAIAVTGRREGGRAAIAVSDTGSGISSEDVPHVFERFYRGARARSAHNGGAGLGLAIAASLVQAMGGDITVRSEPARGTAFDIRLPEGTFTGPSGPVHNPPA
jgi:signal transduction histidine kinase